jgi:methylase of polypeptide subunit release factors
MTVSAEAPDEALRALGQRLREDGYRFTTPTPATHARVNARDVNARARCLEDVLGWSRPFAREIIPDRIFLLLHTAGALEAIDGVWRSRLRASTIGDELFFHSAFPTTGANAVFFGPDTYRFCNAIQHHLTARQAPVTKAADIGCGSGAGGIIIARALPEACVVMGDINDAALQLAQINVEISGLSNVEVVRSDLLQNMPGDFDMIVANPPYLRDPLERTYRHGGGEFGEQLSADIIDAAIERLAPGGTLLLYTGSAIRGGQDVFGAAAEAKLKDAGVDFEYRELDPDVFGEELEQAPYDTVDRIAVVQLTARRRDHA